MALAQNSLFLDGDWIESKNISSEGIRYITTGNVGEGIYKEQGAGFISEQTFQSLGCTQVYPGDVLISRLNAPIGRACIAPDLGGSVVTSVDNVIFRPDSIFNRKFIVYLFSSEGYFKHTSNLARGATMQRISRGLLGNIRVAVPSCEEQTQIARFLDYETTRIDALIKEQQRLIDLLKEKRQAVISRSVTKGLYSAAPMKDSGVEWLGKVPAHWETTRLRRICVEINDINHLMPVAVDSGVPFLSAKDLLDDGTLNFTTDIKMISESDFFALSKKICPRRGDIIYSRIGACLGKARLVETDERFLVSYSCCVVRVMESVACPRFIQHLLDGEMMLTEAKMRTQGIGVPDLGLGEIGRFPIALPPIREQQEIARYLDDKAVKFDTLTAQAKRATDLLQEHRSALISAAVTGKIDVRGWQPPDGKQTPVKELDEAV